MPNSVDIELVRAKHKLAGSRVREDITSDHGGALINPSLIVMHFTGGGTGQSSVDYMDVVNTSAHILIERDGSIIQIVPFNLEAWHAGKSSWNGKSGCNHFAIGIEMANYGYLKKTQAGYMGGSKILPPDRVVLAVHKNGNPDGSRAPMGWEAYTPEQIEAACRVIRMLKEAYPSITEVVGHDDVAPLRKVDIGPAAPMQLWKNALNDPVKARASNDDDAFTVNVPWDVNGGNLNVRKGAGLQYDVIGTIPHGKKVTVHERDGNWAMVLYYDAKNSAKTGWVYLKYLKE